MNGGIGPGVARAPDLSVDTQTGGLAERGWSGGAQLFVLSNKAGNFVELHVATGQSALKKVTLYATQGWDYGVLRLSVNVNAGMPDKAGPYLKNILAKYPDETACRNRKVAARAGFGRSESGENVGQIPHILGALLVVVLCRGIAGAAPDNRASAAPDGRRDRPRPWRILESGASGATTPNRRLEEIRPPNDRRAIFRTASDLTETCS